MEAQLTTPGLRRGAWLTESADRAGVCDCETIRPFIRRGIFRLAQCPMPSRKYVESRLIGVGGGPSQIDLRPTTGLGPYGQCLALGRLGAGCRTNRFANLREQHGGCGLCMGDR